MNTQNVIQVSNLSKSYRLGVIGSRTISADLNRWWARVRKQTDPYLRIGEEHLADRLGERIWALKDINFDVQQGEALGIIGRNGAGKSTLLKILSRITAPTTGEVRVKGRIASLLEVGTGFHPELTGRENIFLNGAILGMKKPETERKFDEIVDFAGVEKFIDTPVKRYSSGMYVRLAFAVAAHLDPEILVVDEVLAVGDASFQKKCLGKMGEVAGEGRTVLFVSHNMNSISQLCQKAILIDQGTITLSGRSNEIINSYLKSTEKTLENKELKFYRTRHFNCTLYEEIIIQGQNAPCELIMNTKDPLTIKMVADTNSNLHRDFRAGIHFFSKDGTKILTYSTAWSNLGFFNARGHFELICQIDSLPLIPGEYWLSFGAGSAGQVIDWLENVCLLKVQSPPGMNVDLLPTYGTSGYFWDESQWRYVNQSLTINKNNTNE